MSKNSILLTLGHNSSAIYVKDDELKCGYETERFSSKKADSTFPYMPIMKIIEQFDPPSNTDIYISHWFTDGELPNKCKYWDPDFVEKHFPDGIITSVKSGYTHHDAHAQAGLLFAGDDFPTDGSFIFVVDGFGTFGETTSIYNIVDDKPHLIFRAFGFSSSLGLLYQYSTAFQDMKMHNHEYKMLGYEVHINLLADRYNLEAVNKQIKKDTDEYIRRILTLKLDRETDPLISVSALQAVQYKVGLQLDAVCKSVKWPGALRIDSEGAKFDKRILISYYTQKVCENVIMALVNKYQPENIILSGGVFMNVKINSMIADAVPGKTCSLPIAGDQGAALGLYSHFNEDFKWPGHLFWGLRSFDVDTLSDIEGIEITGSAERFIELIISSIEENGFVNIVRGAMEFGSRALCNTTTLAIPDMSVVDIINQLNGRTSVMPMAPVVTSSAARVYFKDYDKIHNSLEYMCITRKYVKQHAKDIRGAAHEYPDGSITGRPQITTDPIMIRILNHFGGILINTSFNTHGHPIVYDSPQIVVNHLSQCDNSINIKPMTIIFIEEE